MAPNDFGSLVWAPDSQNGFVLGTLVDIGSDGVTVKRADNGQQVKASYDDVFPAEEDKLKIVEDNCALMYLNEGTLLHNCQLLYKNRKIYSYVANILISINPYETIPGLYSPETVKNYRGKSIGQLPPHIYAIADKAYRDMRRLKESQSIIVSGESGAGKTESQKAVLKFLCDNWGSSAGPIQQRILETNPILEAFGNAKTLRNNNSSRFGKFVEIHFGTDGTVAGGFVSHYLLEKSRVCKQSSGERNYHIFYQLIAGADAQIYKKLHLTPPHSFRYLNSGITSFFAGPGAQIPQERRKQEDPLLHDPNVDDFADFTQLCAALKGAGLDAKQLESVWVTVASVLHLGNIGFVENVQDSRGGCSIDPTTEKSVAVAAELLGIEASELRFGLTTRIMQATKGGVKGTVIRVPLKTSESSAARDALAKAIYSRLFDWLVETINKSINNTKNGKVDSSNGYIGVLDIAGFEYFAVNSFEQFCINYCNEKLQFFFNERILNQEQDLYEKEGLNVPRIEYSDNHDCIDLFERKGTGLLDLLDEEARLPRPTSQHYTQAVQQANKAHFRLDAPRKSRLRAHREMRDDDGFLVRHYAGTVCYHTQQFLDKNNDQLHNSLEMLIEQSSHEFLRSLFNSSVTEVQSASAPGRRSTSANRLQAASVGSKFRSQLNLLIEKLTNTGTHFVRCVKPNSYMKPGEFDSLAILSQLKCAGMASVLKLMQKGFPSRTGFADLYAMYKTVLPPELARLDPRLFCKCLFRALGLNNLDFKFGNTKVFFRPGKFAEFDQMLRQDPVQMKELISRVRSWLLRTQWKKAQYGAWSVIKLKNKIIYRGEKTKLLQAAIRGYLTRKHHKPRLNLYRATSNLLARSREMNDVILNLGAESAKKWAEPVEKTHLDIEKLLATIKGGDFEFELDAAMKNYEECVRQVDSIINKLKQQVEIDEQQKIRELERKRMEEDNRQAKEREDEGKREHDKAVMEEDNRQAKEREDEGKREHDKAVRKVMEEERERAERDYEAQRTYEAEVIQMEREEIARRNALREQERLDFAVAMRISRDDRAQSLSDTPSTSMSSSSSSMSKSAKGKYDLSQWKYAELRDTINTSNEMELLLACKEEFHRRLRIYNEWKSRNANSRDAVQQQRAPLAVFNAVSNVNATRAAPMVNPALTLQRYFKVPFSRPADVYKNPKDMKFAAGTQNGVWYAHFNGQWITRQIELHPNKMPVLLIAGKDDLQMCELPLDQTGLTRKKGAEILEHEFETIWTHLGGRPLSKWAP